MHIADYSSPLVTNFISSILDLSRTSLARLGLRSVIVLPESVRGKPVTRFVQDQGVDVEFIEKNGTHKERVRSILRAGSDYRPVILHSHFGTFDVDVAVAGISLGSHTIWHMHSPFLRRATMRSELGELLKFSTIGRLFVERIIAVSSSVLESAVKRGGPASKFVVVENGIDVARARPIDAPRKSELRQRLDIANEEVVFLLMGWPWKRKGVDILVEAAKLLQQSPGENVRCFVVNERDDPALLAKLVHETGNVRIVLPVEDVADLYGLSDCFVCASRAEGLPYAIGEAMAAELPVISSDLPQIIDSYGGAGDGFIPFKTGRPEALAAAMARIASMTSDERRRTGARNGSFVRAHMSLDRWTERILAVYQTLGVFAETSGDDS